VHVQHDETEQIELTKITMYTIWWTATVMLTRIYKYVKRIALTIISIQF